MTFTFNDGIPEANNNPSNDQPDMKINNQSTLGILAVDHISFNTNFGGNHLQVHLPQFTAPVVVNGSATQGSVVYSKAGTTDTAHAQLFFKNANNVDFLLSAVRAFGSFLMTNANTTKINGENFTFLVNAAGTQVVVTLTANATDGSTNFVVIPNYNSAVQTVTYTIAANQITFNTTVSGSILSFIVLQI